MYTLLSKSKGKCSPDLFQQQQSFSQSQRLLQVHHLDLKEGATRDCDVQNNLCQTIASVHLPRQKWNIPAIEKWGNSVNQRSSIWLPWHGVNCWFFKIWFKLLCSPHPFPTTSHFLTNLLSSLQSLHIFGDRKKWPFIEKFDEQNWVCPLLV